MICEVEYKNSKDIVRQWLLTKYQVLNSCFEGINLREESEEWEIVYDVSCPGAGLFFNDDNFEKMIAAGYFSGRPGRYLGEGGTDITEKTIEELKLEIAHFELEIRKLLEKGYKLYMDSETIKNAIRERSMESNYARMIYGLYLIPENEIQNLDEGLLLVSSVDAKETIYDGSMDLQVANGFSTYGIRIMPKYVDEALIKDE